MSTEEAGTPTRPSADAQAGPCSDESSFAQRLRAARSGSRDALGELTDQFRNYLLVVAQQRLGSHLHSKLGASDLVQETFVDAQRKFQQFRGQSRNEWLAWLQCILRTQLMAAVDRYAETAKRDVSREISLDLEDLHGPAQGVSAPEVPPDEWARRADEAARVQRALGQLPEDYRRVIVLRSIEERSLAEVARLMERSEGAVRKLWSRAVDRLGEIMESSDDSSAS